MKRFFTEHGKTLWLLLLFVCMFILGRGIGAIITKKRKTTPLPQRLLRQVEKRNRYPFWKKTVDIFLLQW